MARTKTKRPRKALDEEEKQVLLRNVRKLCTCGCEQYYRDVEVDAEWRRAELEKPNFARELIKQSKQWHADNDATLPKTIVDARAGLPIALAGMIVHFVGTIDNDPDLLFDKLHAFLHEYYGEEEEDRPWWELSEHRKNLHESGNLCTTSFTSYYEMHVLQRVTGAQYLDYYEETLNGKLDVFYLWSVVENGMFLWHPPKRKNDMGQLEEWPISEWPVLVMDNENTVLVEAANLREVLKDTVQSPPSAPSDARFQAALKQRFDLDDTPAQKSSSELDELLQSIVPYSLTLSYDD